MVLLKRAEGKQPFGRTRHRWKDVKMDLREVRSGSMERIDLAQDRDRHW
jgi:hypothetical protein